MNYRTQIDFWSSLGPSVGFALMCELGEMHSYPMKLWEGEKQLIRKERKKQKRTQKDVQVVIRRRPVCITFYISIKKLRNTLN